MFTKINKEDTSDFCHGSGRNLIFFDPRFCSELILSIIIAFAFVQCPLYLCEVLPLAHH